MIDLKYFYTNNHLLKNVVKFYWMLETDKSFNDFHKMIPVRNIDFVIDYSNAVNFQNGNSNTNLNSFIFCGIRNKPFFQSIVGKTQLFGIVLKPGAAYSLLRTPINKFKNKTLSLDDFIPNFTERFLQNFPNYNNLQNQVSLIDSFLTSFVFFNQLPNKKYFEVLSDFFNSTNNFNIKEYCEYKGVSQKTLERTICKYLGTTPKGLLKLNRFRRTYRTLISGKYHDLTSLSLSNGYYDQSHFISEFKSFSGLNPSTFKSSNKAFLEAISNSP